MSGPLSICQGEAQLSHTADLFLAFDCSPHWSPEWLDQFAFSPTVSKNSPFATTSTTSVVRVCLFNLSESGWVEMKPQCWISLHSIVKEVEHILRYFLAIVISSIENPLPRPITHLKDLWLCFLRFGWLVLYSMDTNPMIIIVRYRVDRDYFLLCGFLIHWVDCFFSFLVWLGPTCRLLTLIPGQNKSSEVPFLHW